MSDDSVETPKVAAARFLNSLRKPSHILVAISGGSDSTGLLVLLAEAVRSSDRGHRLSAATVDHGLRAESSDEARDMAALCARLEIPHRTRLWAGEKPQTGLMAAAREARYQLLADIADMDRADLIVTGHTLDDQQETLAMRGARRRASDAPSARGIAEAMLFDRRSWVVRPFLQCRRQAIRDALIARDIGWIDDPSNENTKYERVRVRARLLDGDAVQPPSEKGAPSCNASAAADWLDSHVRVHAGLFCEIDRDAFAVAPELSGYCLGYLAAVIGGQPFVPGRDVLGRILEFVNRGEAGRCTAGGVVFDLRRDALYLVRENRNIEAMTLAPGERGIWDGRFDVVNGSGIAVRIVAGRAEDVLSVPAHTPKGVAQRAYASAPRLCSDDEAAAIHGGEVTFSPRLAPFDRFLTLRDYKFADRLARLFERMPYLPPPL